MLNKDNNPWLGLASYEYSDAYRFFGRENELARLKECVCNNCITTIYGISGAGKTSLVNAGLSPLLEKEDYLPIRIRLSHGTGKEYSRQIIEAVQAAIDNANGDIEPTTTITIETIAENRDIMEVLPEDERLWWFFHSNRFWSSSNHRLCPVVFIDQFEEIFTQNDSPGTIQQFFNSIDSLQYDAPPIASSKILDRQEEYTDLDDAKDFRLVFIIREDFLARLEDYSYNTPALRKNRNGVKRMNGLQAMDVIMRPQPDIVNRDCALAIVSKVAGKQIKDILSYPEGLSIDTSLLSLFCSEVYNKAAELGHEKITTELIDQFGENILPSFYENSMKLVSTQTAMYLESHLLTRSGFRNSVALEDILADGIDKEDLEKLNKKRLIRIETANGTERVEFTHDVLCSIANEHRNSLLEKKGLKSKIWKTIGFSTDLILPTSLILALFNCAYLNLDRLKVLVFLFPALLILFFATTIIPYRHSKDKNNIIISLISTIAINISSFFLAQLNYYLDSNAWIAFLGIIYPIVLWAQFFISFRFKKKRTFKAALGYIFKYSIYEENPVFKIIIKVWALIIILIGSCFVGLTLELGYAVISIPICSIASFHLLSAFTDDPITINRKTASICLTQTLILIGLVFAQYSQHHLLFSVLCFLFLLASVFLTTRYNASETPIKNKLGYLVFAWALSFLIIPCISLGYNIFNEAEYTRIHKGEITDHRIMRFLIIEDSNHLQGVRDRQGIIVPVEYDKIINRVSIEKSYNGIIDITFTTIKDGKRSKWHCSEHLLTNNNQYSHKIAQSILSSGSYKTSNDFLKYMIADKKSFSDSEIDQVIKNRYIYQIENGVWSRLINQRNVIISQLSEKPEQFDSLLKQRSLIDSLLEIERNKYYENNYLDLMVKGNDSVVLDYDFIHDLISSNLELLALNQDQTVNRLILDSIYPRCTNVTDSSNYYVSLSYYKLFARDFKNAERYSNRALALNPKNITSYTNLFTSLYLQGKYEPAFELLEERKDQNCYEDLEGVTKFFGDGVWEDFCDLIEFGVYNPKESEEFQRLKTILKDYINTPRYSYGVPWKGLELRLRKDTFNNTLYGYLCYNKQIKTPTFSSFYWHVDNNDSILWFNTFDTQKRGYYVYNSNHDTLIPPQYDHSWIFSEDLAAVIINDTLGFINKNGEFAIPRMFPYNYEDIKKHHIADIVDFVFHDGYCPMVASPGKHGLINKEGQWVIEPVYSYINHPADGYRIVCKDKKYGLMNTQLEIVLPIEHDWISQDKDKHTIRIDNKEYTYDKLKKLLIRP